MTTNVPRAISHTIEAQEWLDVTGDILKLSIQRLYQVAGPAGKTIKNFLHGVFLGHPLHPVLTDVPIGAYSLALVFDGLESLTEDEGLAKAADISVSIGLAGALGAAAAGLTDYQHMEKGPPRRLGLVHGILNVASTGFYAASWLARRGRNRDAGMGLGVIGYGLMLASAYLGGAMVYDHKVGAKREAEAEEPERFRQVLPVDDLRENKLTKVEVDGYPVLLVRQDDRIYALAETCTHLGGPLSEGEIDGDSVICPWHQSRFRFSDGQPLDGPSTYNQACFETRIRAGQIEIRKAQALRPEPAQIKAPAPTARKTAARKAPVKAGA